MSLESTQTSRSFWSAWHAGRIVVLAVLIVLVGSRIPLPGLDTAALAAQSVYSDSSWSARYSIVTLGVLPILTVLAYVEILSLFIPAVGAWQAASAKNASGTRWIVTLLILAVSAAQGYAVFFTLSTIGAIETGTVSVGLCVLSVVAVTAVLIWVSDMIRFPGLENGLWWLIAIFSFYTLPDALTNVFETVSTSLSPLVAWVVSGLVFVIGIATGGWLLVVARRRLRDKVFSGRPHSCLSWSVLLWPPFLVGIVASHFMSLAFRRYPEMLSRSPWGWDAMMLVSTIILLPIFVFGYLRHGLAGRPEAEVKTCMRTVLPVVAGAQIFICAGFHLVNQLFAVSLFPDGATFIVVVCITLAVLDVRAKRAFPEK